MLGLTERDVCFSAAKLFFAYGLGNALTFPLSVGASVVLDGRTVRRPTRCSSGWIDTQADRLLWRPHRYAAMLAARDLPRARRSRYASARPLGRRCRPRLAIGSPPLRLRIIDGIGSTEMLHIFISNRPSDVRYGTSGKPVQGYRAEVRDDQGRVIDGPQRGW